MPDAVLTFDNPVFHAYAFAASLVLLKLMLQPWMTVYRMVHVGGGYRSPEDTRISPLNPNPDPIQLNANEYVECSRRINLNDLESIPGFLLAGLLFVLAEPAVVLAQCVFGVYVISRALHFIAYTTAQLHDIRSLMWVPSSLSVLFMAAYVLLATLRL